MRITIVRTGGVAGLRRHIEVDTHDLPEDEVAHLRQLVATVEVGASADDGAPVPAGAAARSAGADRFRYDVTVVSGGVERVLRTREGNGPPELALLVRTVWAIAHRGAGDGPETR